MCDMDQDRFDALARSFAGVRTRRGFLRATIVAVAMGAGGKTATAQAACPPGQVRGSGNRCLCRTTGRPPGPSGCPCPAGRTAVNGACVDLSSDPANCGAPGAVCAAAAETCQGAAICRGGSCIFLPAPAGTVCRPIQALCDLAEVCDGVSTACPADAKVEDTTPCGDGNPCTRDATCQGGICTGGELLDGDRVGCSGVLTCVAGVCTLCGFTGQSCCSGDVCNGLSVCQAGVCTACGGPGQVCCPLFPCQIGNNCENDGICRPCGTIGSACCGLGQPCQPRADCRGNVCEVCGVPGRPCCLGVLCDLGTCTAGVCQI